MVSHFLQTIPLEMKVAPRFKLHSHCFTLLTSLLKLIVGAPASTTCAAKTMTYYSDMYCSMVRAPLFLYCFFGFGAKGRLDWMEWSV